MKSLSGIGLGLSVVFAALFLALVAELYYLFWWKKGFPDGKRDIENYYVFCWKRSSSLRNTAVNPQGICTSERLAEGQVLQNEAPLPISSNEDCIWEDDMEADYEDDKAFGPPRFLFTIVEETKEDLESEDGRSRGERSVRESRSKSLRDLLLSMETTPYLSTKVSPAFSTARRTPTDGHNQKGFNPHFESASDARFNRIRASPPPKFKFLQEAEEKLRRKLLEEAEMGSQKVNGS